MKELRFVPRMRKTRFRRLHLDVGLKVWRLLDEEITFKPTSRWIRRNLFFKMSDDWETSQTCLIEITSAFYYLCIKFDLIILWLVCISNCRVLHSDKLLWCTWKWRMMVHIRPRVSFGFPSAISSFLMLTSFTWKKNMFIYLFIRLPPTHM